MKKLMLCLFLLSVSCKAQGKDYFYKDETKFTERISNAEKVLLTCVGIVIISGIGRYVWNKHYPISPDDGAEQAQNIFNAGI